MALPQESLAALLGVRRPSLNKVLPELEREGVVELSYRCVDISDRPALVRAAGRAAGRQLKTVTSLTFRWRPAHGSAFTGSGRHRTKEGPTMNVLAATSLAGNYEAGTAILAGLVGGLGFLMVVYMGLGIGMTRMNFLSILGSMMAPKAPRGTAYAIGFVIHMMLSAAFGLLHAGILTALDVTSVGSLAAHVVFGLIVGSIHAGAVL